MIPMRNRQRRRVQVKKQQVQLPGHQQPIAPPMLKPPDEKDDEPHPRASSSNNPAIPLPTTTPHSFAPTPAEDDVMYDTLLSSQDTIPHHDAETEEPILTEEHYPIGQIR